MGDLYDDDILEWSERQARLLRDVAARENAERLSQGRRGNETPDWANVIEEIESVGRSQLTAVKSLLVQALLHDLKSAAWPQPQTRSVSAMSRDVPHWQAEARGFRDEAAETFAPSHAPAHRRGRALPQSIAATAGKSGWSAAAAGAGGVPCRAG